MFSTQSLFEIGHFLWAVPQIVAQTRRRGAPCARRCFFFGRFLQFLDEVPGAILVSRYGMSKVFTGTWHLVVKNTTLNFVIWYHFKAFGSTLSTELLKRIRVYKLCLLFLGNLWCFCRSKSGKWLPRISSAALADFEKWCIVCQQGSPDQGPSCHSCWWQWPWCSQWAAITVPLGLVWRRLFLTFHFLSANTYLDSHSNVGQTVGRPSQKKKKNSMPPSCTEINTNYLSIWGNIFPSLPWT